MQLLAKNLRENLPAAESALLTLPQVECSVVHRFGPGIYIREVSIPQGAFAIGHHQNFEHVNIMLKGEVLMVREDGSTEYVGAPFFSIGKPGRKVGYIVEDMVWQNIYATEETDVEKLEAHFLTKSEEFLNRRKLLQPLDFMADRLDFEVMMEEYNLDPYIVRAQSENTGDAIDLPKGSYMFQVGDSPIEGKGLCATSGLEPHTIVGPARIGDKRTIVGRYTNHSGKPNEQMEYDAASDTIWLITIKDIAGRKGGESGEEITVDYRQVLKLHGEIS